MYLQKYFVQSKRRYFNQMFFFFKHDEMSNYNRECFSLKEIKKKRPFKFQKKEKKDYNFSFDNLISF